MAPHLTFPEFAPGSVWLVGAGPGDASLLTLQAAHALEVADVILYDALVSRDVLALAGAGVRLQTVGKRAGRPGAGQLRINQQLIKHARLGLRVVRLKCGDPFVFGRGGEELAALCRWGTPVRVVPGVTAAAGCAAAAGIPLTHRDHASALTLIAGRLQDGAPEPDWRSLAAGRQTLVIYMGVATAGVIAARLIANGMDPATPAAVVENGTLPRQRVATGTVATLERVIARFSIGAPAVIVIGDVAQYARTDALPARPQAIAG